MRTNRQGELVAQNLYAEPFGNSGSGSRATNTANTSATNFRLGGEQQDGASGLYYNRARYYNPATGRFTQQDSYGGDAFDQASLNRFAYANNNPTNLTDPSGHCPWCMAAAAIGFVFGAVANYGSQVNQKWQLGGSFYPFGPNNRIDWGEVALGGVKGAIVGGIGGAFGAGTNLAGALGSSVAAGRSMQVADNLLNGKDWANNLFDAPSILLDAAIGGPAHRLINKKQEKILLWRFATPDYPDTFIAPAFLGKSRKEIKDILRSYKENPAALEAMAEKHARGSKDGSPFTSLTSDVESLVNFAEREVLDVVQNKATHLLVFKVPPKVASTKIYTPLHSKSEKEFLWLGTGLKKYWSREDTIPNPYLGGDLKPQTMAEMMEDDELERFRRFFEGK